MNEKELNTFLSKNIEIELTPIQKLKFEILKEWRLQKSREEKTKAFLILTDNEIKKIVTIPKIDNNIIYEIIPKKTAIKYSEQIVMRLRDINNYTLGKVINVWYQDSLNSYDRVKLKLLESGEEVWFDTTQELPNKDALVAVKLNRTWFNDYFYLDDEK